jgi:hypothetical protein
MEQKHVRTFEGSPEPSDIFEPHMPGVELFSDMDGLFDAARRLSATGEYPTWAGELPAEAAAELEKHKGQRSVVIVTPGRMLMPVPAPEPGTVRPSSEEAVRRLMPPDPPLNISVISYTHVSALLEDKRKAIPFFGFLLGFASIGHTVVVFEGHPSAFESGVRGSDVLLVDSGMLPFLPDEWAETAFAVMRPTARVLVHDRATYKLKSVLSKDGRGWVPPGMQDAEAMYTDSLLTLLVAGPRTSVRLTSGEPPPKLSDFAPPEQSPRLVVPTFNYGELDADKIIDAILRAAGWRPYSLFKTSGTLLLHPTVADGTAVTWKCAVTLGRDGRGRRQLLIER